MIGGVPVPRRGYPGAPLLAIAVVAGAPVLLASGVPAVSALTDTCFHLVRFCFAALVRIDAVLHGVPLLLLLCGGLRAIRRLGRARSGRGLLRRLPQRPLRAGEALARLADGHGVVASVRVLVGSTPNPAFTAGIFRPRIYLAASLERALSREELEAVFLHELRHLRKWDPLRCFLAAAVADVFFWLPLMRDAIGAALARIEFAADDAARSLGDLVVAGAILRVADSHRGQTLFSPSFAGPQLLERRVERLLGTPAAERFPSPPRRTLILSAAALALVWGLGVASAAAHASHLPSSPAHCPHHHEHGVIHAAR